MADEFAPCSPTSAIHFILRVLELVRNEILWDRREIQFTDGHHSGVRVTLAANRKRQIVIRFGSVHVDDNLPDVPFRTRTELYLTLRLATVRPN